MPHTWAKDSFDGIAGSGRHHIPKPMGWMAHAHGI